MPAINREPRLTYKQANRIFRYNPKTGHLTYRIAIPYGAWVKPGDRAGCLHYKGYRIVRVDGVNYMEHRVCWLLHYGVWPENEIDHEDLDKANNRAKNMRDATTDQNKANVPARSHSKSGYRGVRARRDGTWSAVLTVKGVRRRVGIYPTAKQAAKAYNKAAKKQWGEFAHLNTF